MRKPVFPHAMPLVALAPHVVRISVGLFVLAALHTALSVLEQISIVYMDAWIPLQSMEEAEWYTLVIGASAQAARIALVGIAIVAITRPLGKAASARFSTARFIGFWLAVSLLIFAATLALDGVGYWLQFSGVAMEGTTFRWAFLGIIYAKLTTYFVLVTILFRAGAFATVAAGPIPTTGLQAGIAGFFLFLLVWLSIDGVLIPLVSYLPVVSPFWFIPNQDEPSRFLVGQGSRLAAEAVAFVLYALLWVRLFGRTLIRSTTGAVT
ncbi:MAG: hypothetical protein AB7I59_09525 [Geminicoccaceae bacterium]